MSDQAQGEFPYRYTAELAGEIERRWQDRWEEEGTYNVPNPVGDLAGEVNEEKLFLLDMFPYPSGKGLHVGHPFGYIATDVVGRFHRMLGESVLHTMGFDAFGLPAEQFAVQTGQHPRITTENNIATMKEQLRKIGLGHDQRRAFATTDEDYVKWTQWIFLQIFNSYYDPQAPGRAEGTTGRARPISDLIAAFESGEKETGGKPWAEMTQKERAELLDSHRLAYVSHAPVNWCPGLGTVLANEEVTNEGRSERGNYPVFKRQLRQWMMRITDYADRLADELDTVDWPDKVVTMQRNWIGRSEGASVIFEAAGHELEVFTTRPDTLFGATFMVVSPEHPLVEGGLPEAWPEGTKEAWTGGEDSPAKAVAAYRAKAANLTEAEAAEREKTGIFTGFFATNPVNGEQIPVFTADYVLMSYGTGAIMAVPAHDERDYDFAVRFDLPIITTIEAPEGTEVEGAYVGDGVIVNSANDEISLNGMGKDEAIATMSAWLKERGIGSPTITYRLRDWLFSRQRYWGEPFPVVYDEDGLVHALPEEMLPVSLPDTPDYSPRSYDPDDADSAPEPPLGRLTDWVKVELDLGEGTKTYWRDTNTMPNWAGSCWYEMRYLDPTNDEIFCAPENEEYWMGPRPAKGNFSGGADLYVGGVEHAVLHLLYARFWHKVLYDLGHVSSSEPFHKLFNQGMIEAYAYTDSRGQYVPADEVEEVERDGETVYLYEGAKVNREYGKIGKSLKNVVSPDEICAEYGADTFRTYEMSMGPLEQSRPWDSRAIVGSLRFLQRLWRNVIDESTGEVTVVDEEPDEKTAKLAARTIADVRTEYEAMRPNTAISKLIVFNNHLTSLDRVPRVNAEQIVAMVAPVAPHIAAELWERLGHEDSVVYAPFPTADETLLVEDTVTCVIQVRGKVRDRIEVPTDISDEELTSAALERERIQSYLEGEPRKIIVRAPGLINIVP